MSKSLVLLGSLASSSSILLPSSPESKSLSTSNDTHTKKISQRALLAKVSAFNRKIVRGVSMNYLLAFEEVIRLSDDLKNLYKEAEFSSNPKVKNNFRNYSAHLLKIIEEDLTLGDADTVDAKTLKAIKLNKNVLSLLVQGKEIEKKLIRGWELRKSLENKLLRELVKEVERFTWKFARKVGANWQKTIEGAEELRDEMSKLEEKISSFSLDVNSKDYQLMWKLKYYRHYLKKILEEDLPADRSNDSVKAEITRAIQKNLLSMINYWKEFEGGLENPHKALFEEATNFSQDVGLDVAMNSQVILENMEARKGDFAGLKEKLEAVSKKMKNRKMRSNLNNYSFYLEKIIGEDLTRGEAENYETKSIKAISLNKNILSLMVHGEKIERTLNWRDDWRLSIKDEGLRELSEEIDRFTWSFAKRVGLNWQRTMEEMDGQESRMIELKNKIASLSEDKAHKGRDYMKKLENYSLYLKKILNEDLPAYKKNDRDVAMEVTKEAQKNLLYMVDHWKEFKGIMKK